MCDLRYQSWINFVQERFSEYRRSTFYAGNPVLSLYSEDKWAPTWITKVTTADCRGDDDVFLLTQAALFDAARTNTYLHISCQHCQTKDGAAYCCVHAPFWRHIEECCRQLELVRQRERDLLDARKTAGLRLPQLSYLSEYVSLDPVSADRASVADDCVIAGDGGKIESLTRRLEDIMTRCRMRVPLGASNYFEASRVMAINMIVNQYWLSHLLHGEHSQYASHEQLKKAAVASLYGMRYLITGIEDVPLNPVLHVVYVQTLPGINRVLSFMNDAVLKMCGIGSVSRPLSGKAYWWKIQQVEPTGAALMLHGKIMHIGDAVADRYPVLKRVRSVLEGLTDRLVRETSASHEETSCPLVAVVPMQCAAPTGDCTIIDITDENLQSEDIPVFAYVIRHFGYDRGE